MSVELVLAVPSKGRLQENTHAFFERAGMPLVQARGSRDYRGQISGIVGVEVAYLSASEIAKEIAAGNVHLGVTGLDLLEETLPTLEGRVAIVTPLGFGHADVVVAVPQAWIDVSTMADLDDVAAAFRARHGKRFRVATKYLALTRRFFADHGVVDYRIVESLGATEGAPAAGAAEAIVDITTTGATLAANALKILTDGVILKSEASLVAGLSASWTSGARAALKAICERVAAERRARAIREVRFTAANAEALMLDCERLFGARPPFGAQDAKGVLHVPASQVFALVEYVRMRGAGTVTVARLDYVFEPDTGLWSDIASRLPTERE